MDLTPIITRLRETVAGLRTVEGAVNVEAAMDGAVNPPAAYLIPLAKRPDPNSLINGHSQRVNWRFGVLLCVTSYSRNVAGSVDLEILHPFEFGVTEALLAWVPAPGFDPISEGPGDLVAFKQGRLWWLNQYTTASYRRVT